jgi:hypothetical protein
MRFVLLHHTGWPGHEDHYDLMLQKEAGENDDSDVLTTYSTAADAIPAGNGEILSLNHAHRRAYLSYEGSLKGGRGSVTRVDEGELEWLSPDGTRFHLHGELLLGEFCLEMKDNVVRLHRRS